MTALTKEEIKALEEDLKAMEDCGPAWPALSGVIKATQTLLQLYKGEHQTDVIMPRKLSKEMYRALIEEWSSIGSRTMGDNYRAMVQAAQEGRE